MQLMQSATLAVLTLGLTHFAFASTAQENPVAIPETDPYVLFDLRDNFVWNLTHYQILDPDETMVETLITEADQGQMVFDMVLRDTVPPYCELRFDPTICDDRGSPVNWFSDLPQTICMDIPANVSFNHAKQLKGAKFLCLEPREKLLLPESWQSQQTGAQTYLSQRIEPGAVTVRDDIATIDILVLDAINTPLATLSPEGYGDAKIGMTEDQVRTAMIEPMTSTREGTDDAECYHLQSAGGPTGLGFMMVDGKLARVSVYADEYDIATSLIRTGRAIQVGDTIDDVRAAYGDGVIEEEHEHNGPEGRYLTWWANDAQTSGIRFETGRDGTVTAIHAGTGSIARSESCY
ncbi:hypothetical protein SAMN02744133_10934 [Thalassospira xiamenensis M-5 = DSM 17429]|nr:hypothetical protein SAMN02744133_10934 [Thalassospira xiamenensis M-5 = DSM 17429]